MEERDNIKKEENKTNYTTTIFKEKIYPSSVSKGGHRDIYVYLIFIDQQYLNNDIVMAKLIHNLFPMIM
jgi:hypothetical protein